MWTVKKGIGAVNNMKKKKHSKSDQIYRNIEKHVYVDENRHG